METSPPTPEQTLPWKPKSWSRCTLRVNFHSIFLQTQWHCCAEWGPQNNPFWGPRGSQPLVTQSSSRTDSINNEHSSSPSSKPEGLCDGETFTNPLQEEKWDQ